MSALHRFVPMAGLIGCVALVGGLAGCPAPDPGAGQVGKAVCLQCHEGVLAPDQTEFQQSAHKNIECEYCHGPGEAHVRTGGREGLLIKNPARFPFETHFQQCATCHAQQTNQYKLSEHFQEGAVRCFECHDPHKVTGLVLPAKDNSLCMQCHDYNFPTDADLAEHTHHPVDPAGTGASRCTPCHLPPLQRFEQADGPHDHTLRGLAPILTVQAIEAGAEFGPPNSCAGTNGCHDGTAPLAPIFDPDNVPVNVFLQTVFEDWFGEGAGQAPQSE